MDTQFVLDIRLVLEVLRYKYIYLLTYKTNRVSYGVRGGSTSMQEQDCTGSNHRRTHKSTETLELHSRFDYTANENIMHLHRAGADRRRLAGWWHWISNYWQIRLSSDTHCLRKFPNFYVPYQYKFKLDGQGRARREAARRRKSESKSKFLSQQWQLANNSKNCIAIYRRTTWHMDLRQLTVYEHFRWVNMRAITFLFVGQSSSRVWLWGYPH